MGAYSDSIKEGFKPQIDQKNATVIATTIHTLPGSRAIKLLNRSKTIGLLYSYDGGTTYLLIPQFGEMDEYVDVPEIVIKSVSGTVAYDLKVALRQ